MPALDPLPLLSELISIPSLNPMGRDVKGDLYGEQRVTEHLVSLFQRHGLPCATQELELGRCNFFSWIDRSSDVTIVLDAHQDTVPVDGMTIPPFEPRISGDRIYGRGSCDVKGGMAAMLAGFLGAAREKPSASLKLPNLLMSCTCEEEATAAGARAIAERWKLGRTDGNSPSRGRNNKFAAERTTKNFWERKPDFVVVAEPTDLKIVVAHKGASRWRILTHGKAAHSSCPSDGVNAIYKMARVLEVLEDYHTELEQRAHHPLCGGPTLSVGRISGGISVNTVADECWIEIDRRCIPGEDPNAAIDDVTRALHQRGVRDFQVEAPWLVGCTLSDEHNREWAARFRSVIEEPTDFIGVPYGTNASRFALAGVPCIVFGPGSIKQAHTADEWLPIPELQRAAEIFFRFAMSPVS